MAFVKNYNYSDYQSPHDIMAELLPLIQDEQIRDKVRDALLSAYNMGRKDGREKVKQEILTHMGIKP